MMRIELLEKELADQNEDRENALSLSVTKMDGDTTVLQVLVADREELPIYVSATEEQIFCIAYLFGESELLDDSEAGVHETMLRANIAIPLSAFGKIGEQYVIYGALSSKSSVDDVLHELDILSTNMVSAIEDFSVFLK